MGCYYIQNYLSNDKGIRFINRFINFCFLDYFLDCHCFFIIPLFIDHYSNCFSLHFKVDPSLKLAKLNILVNYFDV